MFKRLLFLALALVFATPSYALNLTRVKTWSSEVLTAGDLNAEFDNILNHAISNADISSSAGISGSKLDLTTGSPIGSSSPSTGAFTTLTTSGNVTLGDAAGDSVHFNSNIIDFEGTTADAFETSLVITDPTADRTLIIPNANSVTLPTGALFFMVTGACPAGTTDVSATYSNKFVRINATGGTTGGADTHTHAAGSYAGPSHTHTFTSDGITFGSAPGGNVGADSSGTLDTKHYHTGTTDAGGTGAVTGTSASSSNVPAYVTAIACQVN